MIFKTLEELAEANKKYLMKYQMCDEFDATIASSDLLDPYAIYKLPFYRSEYVGTEIIDEKQYEKYRCWLDFNMFDTFDPDYNFEHYIYYQLDGNQVHTVGEYIECDKFYEIEYDI